MKTSKAAFAKTPKAVEITVASVCSMATAERIKAAIEARGTGLYVNLCPYNGMIVVNVSTRAEGATKAKLTEDALYVLAMHAGREVVS